MIENCNLFFAMQCKMINKHETFDFNLVILHSIKLSPKRQPSLNLREMLTTVEYSHCLSYIIEKVFDAGNR